MTDGAYAYTYNNAFSPDISIDTCTIRTKVASVLLMLALCAPSLQRVSACVVRALTTVMLMLVLVLTSKCKQD